jgi:hypothetical protein
MIVMTQIIIHFIDLTCCSLLPPVPGSMVSPEHMDRLVCQILGDLDSARGSEAVTRLRTGIGIRVEGYIGEWERSL